MHKVVAYHHHIKYQQYSKHMAFCNKFQSLSENEKALSSTVTKQSVSSSTSADSTNQRIQLLPTTQPDLTI